MTTVDAVDYVRRRFEAYNLTLDPSRDDAGVWFGRCPRHRDERVPRKITMDHDPARNRMLIHTGPCGCLAHETIRQLGLDGYAEPHMPPNVRQETAERILKVRKKLDETAPGKPGGADGYERMVNALEAADLGGSRADPGAVRGTGRYGCPACGSPSNGKGLKVDRAEDGRAKFWCFGCGAQGREILAALGLSWADVGIMLDGDTRREEGGGQADTEGAASATGDDGWAALVEKEVFKLQLRAEAAEKFAAQQHARTWKPPVSYGNLAEELALPDDDPPWRINGMLGAGHNAILVAGRKTGKTTMVGNLIRSYVDGKPFLGRFQVEPADAGIAVFNYEVDQRQYRRWLRDVGIGNLDRVHVLPLRGRSLPLKNERVRAWVANWLRERHIGMWIVDPYSRAYVGSIDNGNDEAQVGTFLDTLDVIKTEAGVGELVMPVHTPKAKVESGEESAIGSQRLEGWPDVMWYLTRDVESGLRFLRAEGRDVSLDEEQLTYHAETRELVLNGGGNRAEAKRSADVGALLKYVGENPGCSGRDITGALKWGYDRLKEAKAAAGKSIRTQKVGTSTVHYLN